MLIHKHINLSSTYASWKSVMNLSILILLITLKDANIFLPNCDTNKSKSNIDALLILYEIIRADYHKYLIKYGLKLARNSKFIFCFQGRLVYYIKFSALHLSVHI